MESIVEVKGLSVVRGKRTILKDVTFQIKKGEIFGLVGVSGSGKTTLISSIAGLVRKSSGSISYHNKTDIRRWVGLALQFPSFYPELTCTQNLQYFASMYGLKRTKAEIHFLIKRVGLEGHENAEAKKLSGGMQKKLDIACSLVHNPTLLLLDEPTANLDPINRDDVWKLILGLNKSGTTIVVSSHFLDEIEQLCTRSAIVHGATVQTVDSLIELKKMKKGRLHDMLAELVKE